MKDVIDTLETPAECDQLIENVEKRNPDLAKRALRKKIEIQAVKHGAKSDAETEAVQAIYAYEEAQSKIKGHKSRASRTWPMIKKYGIIGTVEKLVTKPQVTMGFNTLIEMGLLDYAFEAVVLRYPQLFSEKAIANSAKRMKEWQETDRTS
jgi:hypothetical protein